MHHALRLALLSVVALAARGARLGGARRAGVAMMAPPPTSSSVAAAASALPSRDAQEPLFRLFMKREGVKSASLDLSTFGGRGRGCRALRDIEAGELLVSLPREATMDLASLTAVPVPPALVSADVWLSYPWYAQLALWVLAERAKGSGSRWAAYLELLPLAERRLDTPYHWADHELDALGYPFVRAAVAEQRALFADLHAAAVASAPGSTLTLEALACACEAVLSRAFPTADLSDRAAEPPGLFGALGLGGALGGALGGGGGARLLPEASHYALLPAVDSLNHRSGATGVFSYDSRSRALELRTGLAVRAGAEAFLEYGRKGNDELLLLYGFVEAANPYDEFATAGLQAWLRASHPPVRALADDEWARRLAAIDAAALGGALDAGALGAYGAGADEACAAAAALALGGSEALGYTALAAFCRARARELPNRQEARGASEGARAVTIGAFVNAKRATLKAAEGALKRAASEAARKRR